MPMTYQQRIDLSVQKLKLQLVIEYLSNIKISLGFRDERIDNSEAAVQRKLYTKTQELPVIITFLDHPGHEVILGRLEISNQMLSTVHRPAYVTIETEFWSFSDLCTTFLCSVSMVAPLPTPLIVIPGQRSKYNLFAGYLTTI